MAFKAGVLGGVALLKAQVGPEQDTTEERAAPRKPDVPSRRVVHQIASAFAILVGKDHFTGENTDGEPSVATLTRLLFTKHGAPGLLVNVRLTVSNSAKAKPEKQTSNWEEVLRRDEKRVVDEETCQEVQE